MISAQYILVIVFIIIIIQLSTHIWSPYVYQMLQLGVNNTK